MLSPERLQQFENGLDPRDPVKAAIPCSILGYGEISCVLEIDNQDQTAAKRMPLFEDKTEAVKYADNYRLYCEHLRSAGLTIPPDKTAIVKGLSGIFTLYILQDQLDPQRFCHQLIQTNRPEENQAMAAGIIREIEKIWRFNDEHHPRLALAIDGQLSNWVYSETGELLFIDTSTPLMRINGQESLDPELLLKSAPSFLRWLIRWQFLDDVMTRYYDRRLVYTDLIANLFKEQCADLVPQWISLINAETADKMEPLVLDEVKAYYKEDKLIWRLFLGLRRLDRWIKTKLLGKRYEFVLPGKIKR